MKTWTILVGLVAGCGVSGEPLSPAGTAMESLAVTSRSFPSGGQIPIDYTCDGANRSPAITWSAPPPGTQSFAIVVEDPDPPSGTTFTHWIVYEVGAEARSLPEAVDVAAIGGAAGLNDFKRPGYGGPCPPPLELHHYYFRVFALNTHLSVGPEPSRSQVDAALRGHVLAAGALVGEFSH
jgi:Raf kinase inhibitor-like YbhB/YbcL family protein